MSGFSAILFFQNCAKSSNDSSNVVPSPPQAQQQSASEVLKERFICNKNSLGIKYQMDTYADASRKVLCELIKGNNSYGKSDITCSSDFPLSTTYKREINIGRNTSSIDETVTFLYSDSECTLIKY